MISEKFIVLAVLVSAIGGISYTVATLRGRTQPNRVTWSLWALAPLIAFSAQVADGVGWSAALTFMFGFNPLVIFLASFVNPKAKWQITKFDVICGALSLAGLGLWAVTRSGAIAIVFSIAADLLAGLPTILKAYRFPHTEVPWVFIGGLCAATITLLTVDRWDLSHAAFPIYILLFNVMMVSLLTLWPRVARRHSDPLVAAGTGDALDLEP